MHWANDPVGQIIQSRPCTATGGLVLSQRRLVGKPCNELRACLGQAEARSPAAGRLRIAPIGRTGATSRALLQTPRELALPVARFRDVDRWNIPTFGT